jgi:hypothetical protein
VTHMYGIVERPSASFISRVGEMLVEKYPFMTDSSESNPYVSVTYPVQPIKLRCKHASVWSLT